MMVVMLLREYAVIILGIPSAGGGVGGVGLMHKNGKYDEEKNLGVQVGLLSGYNIFQGLPLSSKETRCSI